MNLEDDREFQQSISTGYRMSPRLRQTLDRLLRGDSEKQIAITLRLSQHTVHVYVKMIYVLYDVRSRGELMARFIPSSVRAAVCGQG